MTIQMTAKRWLLGLAVTALLTLGAAAARPALSISPDETTTQIEQHRDGDPQGPQGSQDDIDDD